MILGHSRNGAAVDDGDILGDITFVGHDGTDLNSRASIIRSIMTADGTNNSLYADLVFFTKRNSGGYPEESLRITSTGGVLVGGHTSPVDSGNQPNIEIVNTSTSTLTLARNDTSIASGNDIAAIRIWGNDSNGTYQQCAEILAEADGDHGTDDKPTALSFKVSADNSVTPVEKLRIDSNGRIGTNGRAPSSYNNPDLLISGDDATLTIMGDGSTNNSSIAALKFRVAGASTGDYTKAGIFAKRMGGYNDLAMIFAMDTVADANGVNLDNEKMRLTSAGLVGIGTVTPATTLDVNGILQLRGSNYTTYATRIYSRLDSTHTSVIESFVNSSTAFEMMGTYADSAGVNPRIVLGAGGQKVGINTTNPQAQLHVAGTIHQTVIEYPSIRPTLDLNFAATKVLDDRITFTRDSLGTYTDDMGIVKYASNNTPRFDHDPTTGESLGLLIEESRTNQFPYSSEFDNGAWNTSNSNATANQITAPDGTTSADKITADATATEVRYINDDTSITSGNVYTQSVFAKAGEVTVLQIAPSTGFASRYQNFDLSTGQLGNGDVEKRIYYCLPKWMV